MDDRATLVEKAETPGTCFCLTETSCIFWGRWICNDFSGIFKPLGFNHITVLGPDRLRRKNEAFRRNMHILGGEVGEAAGTGQYVKPVGSATEKRCRVRAVIAADVSGTREPGYTSCTVSAGMPHAQSPGMMAQGPHTAPCLPAPALGFCRPLDVCSTALLGSDGRVAKWEGTAAKIRTLL